MAFNFFNYGMMNNSTSGIYSSLGEYRSIRSGSYGKLLKAHFSGNESSNVSSLLGNKVDKNDKEAAAIKSQADSLYDSASKLVTRGSKSLFTKKEIEVVDEKTGEKTKTEGYDMEAISGAVKSFVSDYNTLLDKASESKNTNVLRNALYTTKQTKAFSKSLENVGITVGADNKLTVDEAKLKQSNISDLKTLFNGNGSLAYKTAQKSNQIGQATKTNNLTTYQKNGNYSNNYYGSSFYSYF